MYAWVWDSRMLLGVQHTKARVATLISVAIVVSACVLGLLLY